MKIFIDANVLFTAAYSQNGKAAMLLKADRLIFITSDYAAQEAHRNILLKRPASIDSLTNILKNIELVPSIQSGVCPITLPLKDQPIFLSALMANATHLLTGDLKDFGPHMNMPEKTVGIVIQTVAEFLDAL